MITILFPAEPFQTRVPDQDFAAELDAARAQGFDVALISLELLLEGRADRAVLGVPPASEPRRFLYRGWMLTSMQYASLVDAMANRSYTPVNDSDIYRRHHEYPGAWERLPQLMPSSLIVPVDQLDDLEQVLNLAAEAFPGAALVKDFVKSRKHEWFDACYVPSLADRPNALRVIKNFIDRQAENLQGGLVFRELLDLASVGTHSKSKLPIPIEYRTFFLNGTPLVTERYWHEVEYDSPSSPPPELLQEVADRMGEGFFTADTVLTRDGRWYVIETGDGQVSQIPERISPTDFYRRLAAQLLTP